MSDTTGGLEAGIMASRNRLRKKDKRLRAPLKASNDAVALRENLQECGQKGWDRDAKVKAILRRLALKRPATVPQETWLSYHQINWMDV